MLTYCPVKNMKRICSLSPVCLFEVSWECTTAAHLAALLTVLKQLWGETRPMEAHCVFGAGVWWRGAGREGQSVELLLQRQDDPVTLQLRWVESLSRRRIQRKKIIQCVHWTALLRAPSGSLSSSTSPTLNPASHNQLNETEDGGGQWRFTHQLIR